MGHSLLPSFSTQKLQDLLSRMYRAGRFKRLVFFLESCQGGSLFSRGLPADLPVSPVFGSVSFLFVVEEKWISCVRKRAPFTLTPPCVLSGSSQVYTVTSSSPAETSWACDYDPHRIAYLNDCFAISMLTYLEKSQCAPPLTLALLSL